MPPPTSEGYWRARAWVSVAGKEVCFDKGALISERKGDSEHKAGFQQLLLLGSLLSLRECRQNIQA